MCILKASEGQPRTAPGTVQIHDKRQFLSLRGDVLDGRDKGLDGKKDDTQAE